MLVWNAARTTVTALLPDGNMAVEGRQQKRRQDYRQKQRRIFASSVLHLLEEYKKHREYKAAEGNQVVPLDGLPLEHEHYYDGKYR